MVKPSWYRVVLDGCLALGGLVRAPGFQEGRGGDAEEARLLRGLRGLRGLTTEEYGGGDTFLRGKLNSVG